MAHRRWGLIVALFAAASCAAPTSVNPAADRSTPPGEILPTGTATATPASTITSTAAPPTPPPTVTGARTLNEQDSGTTVILRVGETVGVILPSDYHQPSGRGDAIERTHAGGGYPTGSRATATFTAVRTGSAEISSTTDYACLHATPSCALPQQLWSVRVQVV